MIIQVPLWYGCRIKGSDVGAEVIGEYLISKGFQIDSVDIPQYEGNDPKYNYRDEIIIASKELADKVYHSIRSELIPLVIGGDHALSLGSLAGVTKAIDPSNLAVIWIDAHGDLNSYAASITKNIHGMSLGVAQGNDNSSLDSLFDSNRYVNPINTYIIGTRSLDDFEIDTINKKNIWHKTMLDVNSDGVNKVVEDLLVDFEKKGIENIHLSFDVDVLCTEVMIGTGTPVPGGMRLEDSLELIDAILSTNLVRSMDFVEFNPVIELDTSLVTVRKLLDFIIERLYGV